MLTDMDLSVSSVVPDVSYLISTSGTLIAGLVAAVVVYTLFVHLYSKHNGTLCNWPPTPPGWPVLGHLHLIGADVHLDMDALAKKHGPLIHIQLGSTHCLVVSSAEMAKLVLKTHDRSFASRPSTGVVVEIFSHNYQDIALAPLGPHWRHMRKLCITELLSSSRIQSFAYLRSEEISSLVKYIRNESVSGQPVTVSVKLSHVMLNIMSRMTMGKRLISWDSERLEDEAELNKFRETITEMFILGGVVNNFADYFPSIRWMDLQGYERRIRDNVNDFDEFISKMINHKRLRQGPVSEDKKDLVDILLSLPNEVNGQLTDGMVTATMQNLLSAGVDTSASTVEWALAELIRKPSVMERLQAEIDSLVGKSRLVEESDLAHLPYLECVVKETFRLHPAAPLLIPHESIEPCKLLSYDIPAKTRLYVNVWAIGRDPSAWDKPLEFCPERFTDSEIDVRGKHFGILPFGAGRRQCPGMTLGLTIVQFTLARMLHSFDFRLPPPQKPEELDMSDSFGLTIIKTEPLKLMASPRLSGELYG